MVADSGEDRPTPDLHQLAHDIGSRHRSLVLGYLLEDFYHIRVRSLYLFLLLVSQPAVVSSERLRGNNEGAGVSYDRG